MKKQLVFSIILLPILLSIFTSDSFASEGEIYLTNTEGSDAECRAFSVLMTSMEYQILMTCRNLTYPGDVNLFNYVAWAEPSDGGSPERLGTLGVGKVEFETDQPFSRLFVTRESGNRPRTPSASQIMSGRVESLDFSTVNQPQPEDPQAQDTPQPTPSAQPSRNIFSRIFEPGRIIIFVGVVLLIVLVFILTRR